jgi:hypothetical protein
MRYSISRKFLGAHDVLLHNPEAFEPRLGEEPRCTTPLLNVSRLGLEAFEPISKHFFVMHTCQTNNLEEVDSFLASAIIRAEPDDQFLAFPVNIPHQQQLIVSFGDILLVDTDSVNSD